MSQENSDLEVATRKLVDLELEGDPVLEIEDNSCYESARSSASSKQASDFELELDQQQFPTDLIKVPAVLEDSVTEGEQPPELLIKLNDVSTSSEETTVVEQQPQIIPDLVSVPEGSVDNAPESDDLITEQPQQLMFTADKILVPDAFSIMDLPIDLNFGVNYESSVPAHASSHELTTRDDDSNSQKQAADLEEYPLAEQEVVQIPVTSLGARPKTVTTKNKRTQTKVVTHDKKIGIHILDYIPPFRSSVGTQTGPPYFTEAELVPFNYDLPRRNIRDLELSGYFDHQDGEPRDNQAAGNVKPQPNLATQTEGPSAKENKAAEEDSRRLRRNRSPEVNEVMSNASRLPRLCWNCKRPGHRYSECRAPRKVFCNMCGRCGYTARTCPKCAEAWRALGPYVPDLGRNVPRTNNDSQREPSRDQR